MDLEILNIAADIKNNKNIENRTHISKLKNSLCGDEMQIELIIKNEKIMRVSYDNFDSKEEALISLSKIRKENPQAWILTI